MSNSVFDAFQGAQDVLFDKFGIPATYNGTAISVCINGYETAIEQNPEIWAAAATVDVRKTEVPAPKRGDTLNMEDTDYQVGDVISGDSLSWTLALTKEMVRL